MYVSCLLSIVEECSGLLVCWFAGLWQERTEYIALGLIH